MNKKIKTYVLLIMVIGLWGTIAYKFFSVINTDLPTYNQEEFVTTFKPKAIKIDTFSIQAVSRDPFLGAISTKKRANRTSYSKKAKDTIQTPKMVYLGLLQKQQSKSQIFVLNINDEQFIVKRGQIVKKVKIVNADSKKMLVRFNNQTITLPIQ